MIASTPMVNESKVGLGSTRTRVHDHRAAGRNVPQALVVRELVLSIARNASLLLVRSPDRGASTTVEIFSRKIDALERLY
jgi:hypothetical protein